MPGTIRNSGTWGKRMAALTGLLWDKQTHAYIRTKYIPLDGQRYEGEKARKWGLGNRGPDVQF